MSTCNPLEGSESDKFLIPVATWSIVSPLFFAALSILLKDSPIDVKEALIANAILLIDSCTGLLKSLLAKNIKAKATPASIANVVNAFNPFPIWEITLEKTDPHAPLACPAIAAFGWNTNWIAFIKPVDITDVLKACNDVVRLVHAFVALRTILDLILPKTVFNPSPIVLRGLVDSLVHNSAADVLNDKKAAPVLSINGLIEEASYILLISCPKVAPALVPPALLTLVGAAVGAAVGAVLLFSKLSASLKTSWNLSKVVANKALTPGPSRDDPFIRDPINTPSSPNLLKIEPSKGFPIIFNNFCNCSNININASNSTIPGLIGLKIYPRIFSKAFFSGFLLSPIMISKNPLPSPLNIFPLKRLPNPLKLAFNLSNWVIIITTKLCVPFDIFSITEFCAPSQSSAMSAKIPKKNGLRVPTNTASEAVIPFPKVIIKVLTGAILRIVTVPAKITAAAPTIKLPMILIIFSKDLLIKSAAPASMFVIPVNNPPKIFVNLIFISAPTFCNLLKDVTKLFVPFAISLYSLNNLSATLGIISSDIKAPAVLIWVSWAVLTPTDSAKIRIAGGNFSPNCCLNSSIVILPLDSIWI